MPRVAKGSVAHKRRSSADWMPEKFGRRSAGFQPRHKVTMPKASFKTLSMRRVCALRHQNGVQYSAIEWTKHMTSVCFVLAPATRPETASHLINLKRVDSCLRNRSS